MPTSCRATLPPVSTLNIQLTWSFTVLFYSLPISYSTLSLCVCGCESWKWELMYLCGRACSLFSVCIHCLVLFAGQKCVCVCVFVSSGINWNSLFSPSPPHPPNKSPTSPLNLNPWMRLCADIKERRLIPLWFLRRIQKLHVFFSQIVCFVSYTFRHRCTHTI